MRPASIGSSRARSTIRRLGTSPTIRTLLGFGAAADAGSRDGGRRVGRAVDTLGLRSCSVGFILGEDRTLADPECDEFLSTIERLDVPILLHPVALAQDIDVKAGRASWLLKYQMDWAWGYLFTETIAVVGLIFSGALDRHPDLRVMVPHGGGMIPYQLGRMEYQARVFGAGHRGAGARLEQRPEAYLSRLYFDTVVHRPAFARIAD